MKVNEVIHPQVNGKRYFHTHASQTALIIGSFRQLDNVINWEAGIFAIMSS